MAHRERQVEARDAVVRNLRDLLACSGGSLRGVDLVARDIY